MRQTVVVCSRPDDSWFDVLAGDADAVVVPVVDDETVSRAIALTDLVDAGRLTVVRPVGARGRTTEVRRRLGEAGIRTVLDVTESVEGLDGGEGLPGIAAGEADSADADWSRAAAVILRPRPAGRGHASAEPVLSFESTTATLRARSHGERGRVGHGLGRSIGGARAADVVAVPSLLRSPRQLSSWTSGWVRRSRCSRVAVAVAGIRPPSRHGRTRRARRRGRTRRARRRPRWCWTVPA